MPQKTSTSLSYAMPVGNYQVKYLYYRQFLSDSIACRFKIQPMVWCKCCTLTQQHAHHHHFPVLMAVFQVNLVRMAASPIFFLHLLWNTTSGNKWHRLFDGMMSIQSPNQQHQGTERNAKNWLQPVAWPHPFSIDHRTPKGRSFAPVTHAVQRHYLVACTSVVNWPHMTSFLLLTLNLFVVVSCVTPVLTAVVFERDRNTGFFLAGRGFACLLLSCCHRQCA